MLHRTCGTILNVWLLKQVWDLKLLMYITKLFLFNIKWFSHSIEHPNNCMIQASKLRNLIIDLRSIILKNARVSMYKWIRILAHKLSNNND